MRRIAVSDVNMIESTARPTVVLTGPTSGLGRALFEQLIAQEFPLVGLGRNLERIKTTTKKPSPKIQLIELDLAAELSSLSETLVQLRNMGSLTPSKPLVFVNNAAIIEPIGKATVDNLFGLERAMRINCQSPLFIANLLVEITRRLNSPLLILNLSSGAALRPIHSWQTYCSSKAACKMGLDVLAAENPKIKIIHFDPGVMDTPMQQLIREQRAEDMPEIDVFLRYHVEGQLKEPLKVAIELIQLINRNM